MKLATVEVNGATSAARVEGDQAVLIPGFADVGEVLRSRALATAARVEGLRLHLDAIGVLPVVLQPQRILCVGMNYISHIAEMGRETPTHPTLFPKWAGSLVGAGQPITLPPESEAVDWEGELAVVIGRPTRRVTEAQAADAIAGYTIMNDISMRDWQYRTSQWLQGKTWDRSTPLGPVLATPEELPAKARLTTTVNGQVMQDDHVDDLLFGPAHLVAYVSTMMTLLPGDIIATGTPAGVGHARKPPQYLTHGDRVTVTIEGIGSLSNLALREDCDAAA
ncbi:MAG: fumarylacetoacetate hydrolase family protein [Bifidobacteriaceae bacterium]|jgi:acylpyruvate hydrolase|nr:fumarylacetoacetate hydrolase family protein [Bifidobacteriaceae bacterium]